MTDRLTTLAYRIADGAARSDVETLCQSCNEDGSEPSTADEISACWYDVSQLLDPEYATPVSIALEYLTGRGMLRRHQMNANWLRVKDEPTIARAA